MKIEYRDGESLFGHKDEMFEKRGRGGGKVRIRNFGNARTEFYPHHLRLCQPTLGRPLPNIPWRPIRQLCRDLSKEPTPLDFLPSPTCNRKTPRCI